jgi:hypothetical protein
MDNRKPSFWAGSWYFLITIVSVGLLAWVPFTHAAGRLRRRSIAGLAVLYAALSVTAVVLIFVAPTDAQDQLTEGGMTLVIVGELLLLALVIGGCMHQIWLRHQVYHVTTAAPEPEPELAVALRARARRAAARKLVADDPLIARELRIGRPDLPGDYDDGGLVDLNNAPAAMIATACELTQRTADGIVAARIRCGGFLTVEDLFSMADIPIGAWDMVRDRSIVIPPTA